MKRLLVLVLVGTALVHLVALGIAFRSPSPRSSATAASSSICSLPPIASWGATHACDRCARPLARGGVSIYDAQGVLVFHGCGECLCDLLRDYRALTGAALTPPDLAAASSSGR